MRQPTLWLESAIEHLDVALILVGADRRVAYANGAAHRLFGMAAGHLQGQGVERLVVTERRGELRNVEDVLAGGGARRVRSVVRREDGGRADVTMTIEPCLDEQGYVAAVSIRYELVPAGGRATLTPGRSSLVPERVSMPPRPPSAPSLMPPKPFDDGRADFSAPLRHSEQRLTAARLSGELEVRLQRIKRHLQWLDERLSVPATVAPMDDARERARAMLVVGEARGLVEECLGDLSEPGPAAGIPAPPKLPRM